MKHLLLTTIAVTLLMGCIKPQNIWNAAVEGNIEEVINSTWTLVLM